MARTHATYFVRNTRFPHPRGDGPLCPVLVLHAFQISPPTWGWPALHDFERHVGLDFPTHVGMARVDGIGTAAALGFPHPRGDGPHLRRNPLRRSWISPPTWGWPAIRPKIHPIWYDFPTHVGMARVPDTHRAESVRFPHPRGDGPSQGACRAYLRSISPPTWGWPAEFRAVFIAGVDFPTHVGMARLREFYGAPGDGFPHPRGDGPGAFRAVFIAGVISPPTWGWPVPSVMFLIGKIDFPTHVGMARFLGRLPAGWIGFPHPRGDGPVLTSCKTTLQQISPPTWGWPALCGWPQARK